MCGLPVVGTMDGVISRCPWAISFSFRLDFATICTLTLISIFSILFLIRRICLTIKSLFNEFGIISFIFMTLMCDSGVVTLKKILLTVTLYSAGQRHHICLWFHWFMAISNDNGVWWYLEGGTTVSSTCWQNLNSTECGRITTKCCAWILFSNIICFRASCKERLELCIER